LALNGDLVARLVPMPSGTIPQRSFGRNTSVQISALGFGGHHLGDAEDEPTAARLVAEAIDGGITFFDNCWEYHRGKSEDWMGSALKGKRDGVFLMTKVCTHGRDKDLAMKMLEQSLRRLQTDHLDLWQVHGICFDNDPDLFIRKSGAAEALEQAKQGKVRFVGFTGHKDPSIHLKMLRTNFPFDAVQMPLNPFDATFRSFQNEVVPEAVRRGIAVLGMKPFCGSGNPVKKGVLTPEEALRYAMSVPGVTVTITGMEKPDILRQNLKIAQDLQTMRPDEMHALASRLSATAADGRFELFKVSLKYDNPEARMAHGFPLDMQQKEVKEMVRATENTGDAYPKTEQPQ
jgi:aryl-alcohol dehydrogenase-like predicted oxidoreductase